MAVFLSLIITLFIWRVPNLVSRLKKHFSEFSVKPKPSEESKQNTEGKEIQETKITAPKISFHDIVFSEFLELLRDLPYFVLLHFSFWRIPSAIYYMSKKVSLPTPLCNRNITRCTLYHLMIMLFYSIG